MPQQAPTVPPSPGSTPLPEQAAALFLKAFGDHPGFRLAHAKGIVCEGTFEPAKSAAALSKAAHFNGGTVPVIVRFSDGTGVPQIPDGNPDGNPKGMAIRFLHPGGGKDTDIVANGHNGFVVGTGADFVAFLSAALSSGPDSPKPTPIEKFIGSHPGTLAFVTSPKPTPASFATQAYFGNNAFIFVNAQGQRRATRYQILPLAGEQHLDDATAATRPPNFLMDEIAQRLAKGTVAFRLLVQVAQSGDPTADATKVWPDDRQKVELGTITLTRVDPKSDETQRKLTMDPTHLIEGIELSDDPLPVFRSQVYSISISRRM